MASCEVVKYILQVGFTRKQWASLEESVQRVESMSSVGHMCSSAKFVPTISKVGKTEGRKHVQQIIIERVCMCICVCVYIITYKCVCVCDSIKLRNFIFEIWILTLMCYEVMATRQFLSRIPPPVLRVTEPRDRKCLFLS